MSGDKLTDAEPVERQELSERLLGLIGSYEMGAALDAQDLHINTAPERVPSLTEGRDASKTIACFSPA